MLKLDYPKNKEEYMKTIKFSTTDEAIRSFTKEDEDYIFVRHVLAPEEKIEEHYHKKANEWIVIDNGKFMISIGGKKEHFDLQNEIVVICFPKGKTHYFLAKNKVSYFVFRDCEDEIIYTEK
jgi:mannose-6-phosphate isomerase-like protein (cupin superfamily)